MFETSRLPFVVGPGFVWLALSCSTATKPPENRAPQAPPPAGAGTTIEPDLPVVPGYVGELAPVLHERSLDATVRAQGKWKSFRVVALELGADFLEHLGPVSGEQSWLRPERASFVHAPAAAYAFALLNDSDGERDPSRDGPAEAAATPVIWMLVPETQLAELRVELVVGPVAGSASPGFRARVNLPPWTRETNGMDRAFGRALSRHLAKKQLGALGTYAESRLAKLHGTSAGLVGSTSPSLDGDLSLLMELGTGYASVELALEQRRSLSLREKFAPKLPLDSLVRPQVRHHEWDLMLKQLGRTAPPLPLALATPERFYLVHTASAESLFAALDELDRWGTPLAHLLEPSDFRYRLADRYQTELGLRRGPLTKLLGPQAIAELALVGSDPFLRRGSDLTVLFRAKNRLLLRSGLTQSLAELGEEHGGLEITTEKWGGVSGTLSKSDDGAVRRYQVDVEDVSIVSNSRAAVAAVLDTVSHRAPSLGDAADFRYMRARDLAEPADVLFYAGDAFIESIVSPRVRVLDARRGLAWAELRRIGFAAVLNGLLGGAADDDAALLMQSGALDSGALAHFDGQKLTYDGKTPPRSAYGTPARMASLIDLPTPQLVSLEERRAYENFVSSYEQHWSEAIDPIALRLQLSPRDHHFRAHLRVLPIVRNHDYSSIQELVGDVQVDPGAPALGVRALVALDRESSLRRDLEGSSQMFLGQNLSLEWVGQYAFVGLADRPGLVAAVRNSYAPRAPGPASSNNWEEDLRQLPIYAGIQVKSRAVGRLFLEFARQQARSTSFNLAFDDVGTYQNTTVTRVSLRGESTLPELFYALGQKTLFLTLDRALLNDLLDREAQGREPGPHEPAGSSSSRLTQFALELAIRQKGALATVLTWADQEGKRHRPGSSHFAEIAFAGLHLGQGVPPSERSRRSFALFGEEPVTPDGLEYVFSAEGLQDPAHGNAVHPRWPELPIAGSDWARLLGALAFVRSGMSFDAEPPGTTMGQRSLRMSIDVDTR